MGPLWQDGPLGGQPLLHAVKTRPALSSRSATNSAPGPREGWLKIRLMQGIMHGSCGLADCQWQSATAAAASCATPTIAGQGFEAGAMPNLSNIC